MDLCSENHDEICYVGNRCPVCGTIEELEGQIVDLSKELEAAESRADKLEEERDDARAG